MAKIDEYLNNILLAKYGRDVRGSIHDAIELINAIAGIKFGTDVTSASSPKGDYEEGTFYINTDTNDLWHLTASTWELVGNIKGDKGDKGDQGNQGEQGIQGVQGDKGDKGDKGDDAPTITNVVEKSHVGLVHTYTIELSDGTGYDFTVSDGQSGSGAGDMLKSVYDTNGDGVVDKASAVGNATTSVLEGLSEDADGKLNYKNVPIGTEITLDTTMSDTSENAVQNKVIKSYVDEMQDNLIEYADGSAKSMEYDEDTSILSLKDANGTVLSEVEIQGGGGSSGSTINGMTNESSLFGKEVTLSFNGEVIKTTTISLLGTFTFSKVQQLGVFTISATDGTDIADATVEITQWSCYECSLSFYTLYGFHIDPNESDPDARVTYLSDCKNANYTPAFMNFSTNTFDWGSWSQDEFFMPRSCMLKSNGTVDYYLDENDNSKKLDGTTSDIANTSYDGNAMMEWGRDGKRIYWKIVPDTNTDGGKVYICDKQIDEGFKDFNFRDANGNLISHFYTPKYNGSLIGSKLRSMSGQVPIQSKTATQEVQYAQANNPSGQQMWYIEVVADWMLINFLLTLMCKSTNTQNKYGYGNIYNNPQSASAIINSGTMNAKGMFWGRNSSTTHDGVKVFGMENWWANQWRRLAGFINDKGTLKFKMTWYTNDGSAVTGYNETGNGYLTSSGTTPTGTTGGYTNKAKFDPIMGIIPYTASGSETTYYTDGLLLNNARIDFALVGGSVKNAFLCGTFCVDLRNAPSYATLDYGASVSCKPLGR